MTTSDTEDRLIRAIADHYLGGVTGRLTIQEVSDRAGISRQAFTRYYSSLKPYVLGSLPISDLIKSNSLELPALLAACQTRIAELNVELAAQRTENEKAINDTREGYITTLMCGDIAMKNSDSIRSRLEKQSLHNEILVRDKQRLEAELTVAKAKEIELLSAASVTPIGKSEVIALAPDLRDAFAKYAVSGDQEAFEASKDLAMSALVVRINKLCVTRGTPVILVIDRYLLSFDRYVERLRRNFVGEAVLVRTPILSRTEVKLFASKIVQAIPKSVHFPVCISESIARAQRQFLFRDVPEIEKAAADRMTQPMIQDGFVEVLVTSVQQGD